MATLLLKKLACMAMVFMVLGTLTIPYAAEGVVTCSVVTKSLAPCMAYLRGTGGGVPTDPCCNGAKTLQAMARSTSDRRNVCNCMKTSAKRIKNINYGNAARIPAQCGVRTSFTIGPNMNCNNVQ